VLNKGGIVGNGDGPRGGDSVGGCPKSILLDEAISSCRLLGDANATSTSPTKSRTFNANASMRQGG
jgi:hypothetical protein